MKISKTTITKKVTITIGYDVKPDGVICINGDTARFLWGSTIAITDLNRQIKRTLDDKYFIPKETLLKRQTELINKKNRIENYLKVMNEITKEWRLDEK